MRNKKYIIPEISAQSIIASARQTGDGYIFYFDNDAGGESKVLFSDLSVKRLRTVQNVKQ